MHIRFNLLFKCQQQVMYLKQVHIRTLTNQTGIRKAEKVNQSFEASYDLEPDITDVIEQNPYIRRDRTLDVLPTAQT